MLHIHKRLILRIRLLQPDVSVPPKQQAATSSADVGPSLCGTADEGDVGASLCSTLPDDRKTTPLTGEEEQHELEQERWAPPLPSTSTTTDQSKSSLQIMHTGAIY